MIKYGLADSIPMCDGCKYKARCGDYFVCNYSDDTGKTRAAQGVKIGKDGMCDLYEKGEHPRDTRPSLSKINLPSAKTMELYESGLNDCEIARQLGVRSCDVLNWRRKKGLKANWKRLEKGEVKGSKLDAPEIMELYRSGATDAELARAAGVAGSTVRGWRKVRGLERNKKEDKE